MLRATLLIIGLCTIFCSYGQHLPAKLEKGLVNFSYDSTFALIQKGKKTALYNVKANEFEIPFDKRGKVLSQLDNIFYLLDKEFATKYTTSGGQLKKSWDSQNVTPEHAHEIEQLATGQFIVNLLEVPGVWVGDQYGMDVVPDYANCIQSSGVFDPQSQTWVIPNKFMKIYAFENLIFAVELDSQYMKADDPYRFVYDYTYHIFQEQNNKFEEIKTISKFDTPAVTEILGIDSIQQTEFDPHLYYSYQEGKIGIIYLDLNHPHLFQDYHLRMQNIISPIYDFVWQVSDRAFLSLTAKPEQKIEYFEIGIQEHYEFVQRNVRSDSRAISATPSEKYIYSNIAMMLGDSIDPVEQLFQTNGYDGGQKGLEYINDSLIKIINFNLGDFEALLSKIDDGFGLMDSMDYDGNAVYERVGFIANTGIFNYKTKQWLIPPIYWNVHFAGDHVLVDDYEQGVSILDLDGGLIVGDIQNELIRNSPYLFSAVFPPKQYRKVFKVGKYIENKFEEYPIFRGIKQNGKMDVLSPGAKNLTPKVLISDVDFGIADPHSLVKMYVSDNQITLNFNDSVWTVKGDDAEIRLEYTSEERAGMYRLLTIEQKDTMSYNGKIDELPWDQKFDQVISINLFEENLLCNQFIRYYFDVYDPEFGNFIGTITDESEFSALWSKTDSGYVQVSPNYAQIVQTPASFVAITKEYTGTPDMGSEYYDILHDSIGNMIFIDGIGKRYLLFDSTFNTIQLLDHYDFNVIEDIGFGLKVCTDKGCMFVTYEGQAITDDSWQDFKLAKDGRLIALKKVVNEQSDEMRDKDGVATFFNLPKK